MDINSQKAGGGGRGPILVGLVITVLGCAVLALGVYARHLHKRILRVEKRGGVALGIVDELVRQTEPAKPKRRRHLVPLVVAPLVGIAAKARDHPAAALAGTAVAGGALAGLTLLPPAEHEPRRSAPAEAETTIPRPATTTVPPAPPPPTEAPAPAPTVEPPAPPEPTAPPRATAPLTTGPSPPETAAPSPPTTSPAPGQLAPPTTSPPAISPPATAPPATPEPPEEAAPSEPQCRLVMVDLKLVELCL